jgi:hypothetical protein
LFYASFCEKIIVVLFECLFLITISHAHVNRIAPDRALSYSSVSIKTP